MYNTDDGRWDALWVNARIATMGAATGYGTIEDGALAVKDGRIAFVGRADTLPGLPETLAATIHDAGGLWMTPGLIDCHTHLVYAGTRAREFEMRLKGKSYADIARAGGGILSTVKATRAASEQELYAQSEKRLQRLLAEGVTTVEIKSGYGLDLDSELKMLRVARNLGKHYPVTVKTSFLGAHAVPPEFAGNAEGYVTQLCDVMLPAVAELADAVDGFCESIGFSAKQMERVFAAARAQGLRVKLHAEQLSDQGGAALAAKHNALSADHLEYLSEAGVRAMAEAGTVAVLLPGAFYYLKETKLPPVAVLRAAGVPMALATDCNPGTSPVTSLLLMLNMGCLLFGLTPEEALAGVTRHAARALGMAQDAGTLEEGKRADFVLWDIEHPSELCAQLGGNPAKVIVKEGVVRR
ncbi:MAG: imidazolonepropionase [Alphaproteobacteria bacterium]|nr:imidazolonepropionase [Alphaproteobacteria bacterium]